MEGTASTGGGSKGGGSIDHAACCAFFEGIVRQMIKDARIDPLRVSDPRARMDADYRRRKALYDFECMKDDPEGVPLLQALSAILGRTEVELLDGMLVEAGVPWDIQPDVLADGPRLRLWDALGIEEQEAA